MSKQAYKFRLYPTRKQQERLQWTLDRARELYNAALQERRDAYRMVGKAITYYDQANQLPEIKGTIKTCTIKREGDAWYIVLTCEVEPEPLEEKTEAVGIDLGLLHFATLSTGETIENPRYFRQAEQRLERLQQALSRKKCGSHRRRKAVKQVAHCHRKVANQRRDFLHKQSRKLVNTYGTMVFEELQPANMSKRPKPKQDKNGIYLPNGAAAKGGLNKSIMDAGWGMFQQFCLYKAANAGRTVLFVNPNYTSQVCSGCGHVCKKDLSERWHRCECGTELDRDHNAALNILALGRRVQAAQAS